MTTFTGMQTDFIAAVKDLVYLEHDAISAYEKAIEKIESEAYKIQLSSFRTDHHRHIQELTYFLTNAGEEVPQETDFKEWLTKGKVILATLIGDHAILQAMKSNEVDMNTAYERMVARKDKPEGIEAILESGLKDEIRHHAWFSETLK